MVGSFAARPKITALPLPPQEETRPARSQPEGAAFPRLPRGTFGPLQRTTGLFLIWFGVAWISAALLLGWIAYQPDLPAEFEASPNQELAWTVMGLAVLASGAAVLVVGLIAPKAPVLERAAYGELRCPSCDQELMSLVGRCPYCNQPLGPPPPSPGAPPT